MSESHGGNRGERTASNRATSSVFMQFSEVDCMELGMWGGNFKTRWGSRSLVKSKLIIKEVSSKLVGAGLVPWAVHIIICQVSHCTHLPPAALQ